jgi:hypothetical protein
MIVVTVARCGLIRTDDVRKQSMIDIFKKMAQKGECINHCQPFFKLDNGTTEPKELHCLGCKYAKVRDKKQITKNGNKEILCQRKILLDGGISGIIPRGWIDEEITPPGWIKVSEPDSHQPTLFSKEEIESCQAN